MLYIPVSFISVAVVTLLCFVVTEKALAKPDNSSEIRHFWDHQYRLKNEVKVSKRSLLYFLPLFSPPRPPSGPIHVSSFFPPPRPSRPFKGPIKFPPPRPPSRPIYVSSKFPPQRPPSRPVQVSNKVPNTRPGRLPAPLPTRRSTPSSTPRSTPSSTPRSTRSSTSRSTTSSTTRRSTHRSTPIPVILPVPGSIPAHHRPSRITPRPTSHPTSHPTRCPTSRPTPRPDSCRSPRISLLFPQLPLCQITNVVNPLKLTKEERRFKEDPYLFIRQNAITTQLVGDLNSGYKQQVPVNGNVYEFGLRVFEQPSTSKSSNPTYILYVKPKGAEGIRGLWLSTGETIDEVGPATDFIFTAELQSCSLYAGYSAKSASLNVFHHNVLGTGKVDPVKIISREGYNIIKHKDGSQKRYSCSLTYETYDPHLEQKLETEANKKSCKVGPQVVGATAFFYRMRNSGWALAFQKLLYPNLDLFNKPKDVSAKIRGVNTINVPYMDDGISRADATFQRPAAKWRN